MPIAFLSFWGVSGVVAVGKEACRVASRVHGARDPSEPKRAGCRPPRCARARYASITGRINEQGLARGAARRNEGAYRGAAIAKRTLENSTASASKLVEVFMVGCPAGAARKLSTSKTAVF